MEQAHDYNSKKGNTTTAQGHNYNTTQVDLQICMEQAHDYNTKKGNTATAQGHNYNTTQYFSYKEEGERETRMLTWSGSA